MDEQLDICYQVVNKHGFPATDASFHLCIFYTEKAALSYIDEDTEEFKIKLVAIGHNSNGYTLDETIYDLLIFDKVGVVMNGE
ncbi:MAG: hypothetical protein KAS32_06700 [Candidatus Peribacteraceae bacterium]|nr:hypothetical protein [Candidatus Peribacteraceae bacterium]